MIIIFSYNLIINNKEVLTFLAKIIFKTVLKNRHKVAKSMQKHLKMYINYFAASRRKVLKNILKSFRRFAAKSIKNYIKKCSPLRDEKY